MLLTKSQLTLKLVHTLKVKNDELTTAVIKQFKNAQPMPNISQMSAVWDPAKTMLFDAVSGKKDAKTAANDAVTLIKETIKQKFGE